MFLVSQPLLYTKDGKFWALADGNKMLEAYGCVLDTIDQPRFGIPGKYVVYCHDHFYALKMHEEYFTLLSSLTPVIQFGTKVDLENH